MHVRAKRIAFGGLGIAASIVCMSLGSIIETNTLFFLAAASFLPGIMVREAGFKSGVAYYLAAVLLGFLLTPDKFYVGTYCAMSLYILIIEWIWVKMGSIPPRYQKRSVFWICKYLVFNIIYIPVLFGAQKILFGSSLQLPVLAGLLLAGQAGLLLYDTAYEYLQARIWPRFRNHIFTE